MLKEIIKSENVSLTFFKYKPNEVKAIKDFYISINEGEAIAFIGPSGSGKTSLLSILGCMTKPTSGDLFILNERVTKWPEKYLTLFRRKNIGFVFQNFNLINHLTVYQNIVVPLVPLGLTIKEINDRVLKWSDILNLENRLHFPIDIISGGEMQRTAFARAMISDPKILIADEPTSHLDTQLSKDIISIFTSLKNNGKTILIATHDPLVYNSNIIDRKFHIRDGILEARDN